MSEPRVPASERPREIWTRLVIDPLADPVARVVSRHRWVTPNRVTVAATALGVAGTLCLATGQLRAGGALFLLRFYLDCLDGKVARLQRSQSGPGALLDVASDVLCVSAGYAALCLWAVREERMPVGWAVAALAAAGTYQWALAHRKHLAADAGRGNGGSDLHRRTDVPVLGRWLALCRRLNMSPVPWAVEAETVALGLIPLLWPAGIRGAVLVVLAFYVTATLVNLRRLWHLAGLPPVPRPTPRSTMDHPAPMPSVDVVIATRHRPQMLREAVQAVLAQRYRGRIRCLVVYDGTEPDLTLRHADAMRVVQIMDNSHARGLAGARNTGILAADADLVAFCDDDDLWLPGKLEQQVEAMLVAGTTVCVTGIVVDYAGTTTTRVPAEQDLELRNLVRNRVMEAHPSTVVVRRSELLGRIGLVDEEIPGSYGEDFDWMIRAAGAGPITVVPRPLVRVRWGGSQFSRNWRVIADAIDYGLAKHPAFHEDRRALARLYGRKAFALAALGDAGALRCALRSLSAWPAERRGYLAVAVAAHVLSADRLLDLAHRRGHGI